MIIYWPSWTFAIDNELPRINASPPPAILIASSSSLLNMVEPPSENSPPGSIGWIDDSPIYAWDELEAIQGCSAESMPTIIIRPKTYNSAEFEALRKNHIEALQNEIRRYVDGFFSTEEREALAALLQKTTLMRMMGIPVNEAAMGALMTALDFVERAMVLGSTVAGMCAGATTAEELHAIDIDPATILGAGIAVSAGQIASMLRGE